MTSAPQFLIIRQPFFFTVEGEGIPLTRIGGDVRTTEGRQQFLIAASRLHPNLARGVGLTALCRAIRELANGEPNAGTITDELRECCRAVALAVREMPSQRCQSLDTTATVRNQIQAGIALRSREIQDVA